MSENILKSVMSARPQVWVVDDSRLEAQRIASLLSRDYAVESFSDGAAMLERISARGKPDLVLLDWQMPGISGVDACRFLRERYDEVSLPILMLTARGAKQDFTEGLSAGANDYVAKPYDDAELLARVRTLVRIRRQAEASKVREEWFATTLQSIGEAVITTDANAHITFFNRIAAALTGWTSNEAMGQPFSAVFQALDERTRANIDDLVSAARLKTHAGGPLKPMLLRRKDGVEVPIEENVSVVGDGAVIVFRDISERRKAEKAAKGRADFEEKLIGIVSHDLRSPLQILALSTGVLLGRKKLDEIDTKTVERLRTTGQRATRLVSDLLDFTQGRLGTGIRVTPREADVHVIANHVLEEAQTIYPERTLRHEPQADGAGRWDPDRITQLLTNLTLNAIKYGDPTTQITIRTTGHGDEVLLSVHNGGAPIPADLLPVVFEPMRRGNIEQGDRSVGLGLYIVKDIVEAHGGAISVTSTAEAGTTFVVRLPRKEMPRHPRSE